MEPKDFGNAFNGARQEVRYVRGLSRRRQIVDQHLELLHAMHFEMIEDAVYAKELQGFPEATQIINYIRAL